MKDRRNEEKRIPSPDAKINKRKLPLPPPPPPPPPRCSCPYVCTSLYIHKKLFVTQTRKSTTPPPTHCLPTSFHPPTHCLHCTSFRALHFLLPTLFVFPSFSCIVFVFSSISGARSRRGPFPFTPCWKAFSPKKKEEKKCLRPLVSAVDKTKNNKKQTTKKRRGSGGQAGVGGRE